MKERRFVQVDVFSDQPTKGNALAVVADAEGLTDEGMQRFAAWTNLAETTFLLPPTDNQADYRVRIFTPAREMLFAGHPTLGSCTVWQHIGGVPKSRHRVVQECAIGLVEIDISDQNSAFVAPETLIREMPSATKKRLTEALNLEPSQVVGGVFLENGPSWQLLELRSAKDVLDIDSTLVRWPDFAGLSVIGPHSPDSSFDFEVRNLAPSSGMSEDPITGSLNAAIAKWFASTGRLSAGLTMVQGTAIGRDGRVFIRKDPSAPNRVLVGGRTNVVIDGTVWL